MSLCHIQLKEFNKSLDYLKESYIFDKNNIKTIYRLGYSYLKLDDLDNAYYYLEIGLSKDKQSKELNQLKSEIDHQKSLMDNKAKKLFKKLIN